MIRKKGGNFPVLLDSDFYCRELLQIVRTPTTFIIDESGRIRYRFMGHTKDIEGFVVEVLGRI